MCGQKFIKLIMFFSLCLTVMLSNAAPAPLPIIDAAQKKVPVTPPATISITPGRSIGIPSVVNLRDIGGYRTKDGKIVKSGIVYRANRLCKITTKDMKILEALGIKNVFDLRTKAERDTHPDELPLNVKQTWLNVLADDKEADPNKFNRLLSNPKEANKVFADGKAAKLFIKFYREFVTLPSAKASYHQLFLSLCEQQQLPALFHCSTGKDRTGWAAAALLTLLGVPEEQVYNDYLRSNDYILPSNQPFIDHFVAGGGDRRIILDIFSVKKEYLKASFDEMKSQYGTIENYFEKGLNIDRACQQRLRALFLNE